MRLDHVLTQAGFGSRNQIKKLLKARQVRVDGELALSGTRNVDTEIQLLEVAGERVKLTTHSYLMLHKPQGVVTAVSDSQHPTVIDLLAPKDQVSGLYPIGRLDRDTTGLLLLTNNGPLGFRMLHPSRHVTKVYEVVVNGWLDKAAVRQFAGGVIFSDGTQCQPAQLEIVSASNLLSQARVTIREGKFHQVKKMFLAVGVKVISLKRVAFGEFILDKYLATGSYRPLNNTEKQALKKYLD